MNNDLISRSALRKAVNDFYDNSFGGIVSSDLIKYAKAVDSLIDNVPTVEKRPKGKWIEKEDYVGDTYYDCSNCGNSWSTLEGTPWQNGMSFCPNCGAYMER